MHLSMASAILVPGLLFGAGARALSGSSDHAMRSMLRLCPSISMPPGDERGRKMKALGNATALFVALTLMVGLLFAQRSYQNSWREPSAVQSSASAVASAGTLEQAGGYKVVMK